MNKNDLLLEIGCEELPINNLMTLANALKDKVSELLTLEALNYEEIKVFASPRRLGLLVTSLDCYQASVESERQGPSVEKAFDKNGTPTIACLGFARACGVSVDQLKVKKTEKGERVYCVVKKQGEQTSDLLPELINKAISKLPIPKAMRWGNHDIQFIRPVHWVVLLFGRDVINTTILGKKTSNQTRGHRFHHPQPIPINSPKDYYLVLSSTGYVIADFAARKQIIRKQVNKIDDRAIIAESLLNEVTSLVEWPVALKGKFDPEFLKVPKEVLMTSMESHQKYFPIEDGNGELLPAFILVSNIDSKNPSTVIEGNERVINARLSDAAFFYENDKKLPLQNRLQKLDHVIFQNKLGSLGDKTKRLEKLTKFICQHIDADTAITTRAAKLSKCDLVSEMVYEFPSLQGIMGYYYAKNDNEPKGVAEAIKEAYYPRFSGDKLPQTLPGIALALADRLDTIVGILGINQSPTGDKDPFALRRAALGVIRLIVENKLSLDLLDLIKKTQSIYQIELPNKEIVEQAFDFIMGRLRAWYMEQGVTAEVFDAVAAKKPTALFDFDLRIKAVQSFQKLPEASALAAANKRVSNILKKAPKQIPKKTDSQLFQQQEERTLAELLNSHTKTVEQHYQKSEYSKALADLSALKEPVDQFFDSVMVMTDDEKIRQNRLSLLSSLRNLFTQVADISLLP